MVEVALLRLDREGDDAEGVTNDASDGNDNLKYKDHSLMNNILKQTSITPSTTKPKQPSLKNSSSFANRSVVLFRMECSSARSARLDTSISTSDMFYSWLVQSH